MVSLAFLLIFLTGYTVSTLTKLQFLMKCQKPYLTVWLCYKVQVKSISTVKVIGKVLIQLIIFVTLFLVYSVLKN